VIKSATCFATMATPSHGFAARIRPGFPSFYSQNERLGLKPARQLPVRGGAQGW
jgi:hypothetical protein